MIPIQMPLPAMARRSDIQWFKENVLRRIIWHCDDVNFPFIERLRLAKDIEQIKEIIPLLKLLFRQEVQGYRRADVELDGTENYVALQETALCYAISKNPAYFATLESFQDEAPFYFESLLPAKQMGKNRLYRWLARNERAIASNDLDMIKATWSSCRQLASLCFPGKSPTLEELQPITCIDMTDVEPLDIFNLARMLASNILKRIEHLITRAASYEEKLQLYTFFKTESGQFANKVDTLERLDRCIEILQKTRAEFSLRGEIISKIKQYKLELIDINELTVARDALRQVVQQAFRSPSFEDAKVKDCLKYILIHTGPKGGSYTDLDEQTAIYPFTLSEWKEMFIDSVSKISNRRHLDLEQLMKYLNTIDAWSLRFSHMTADEQNRACSQENARYLSEAFKFLGGSDLTPHQFDESIREIRDRIASSLSMRIHIAGTPKAVRDKLIYVYSNYYVGEKANATTFKKITIREHINKYMDEIKREVGAVQPAWVAPLQAAIGEYNVTKAGDDTDAKAKLAAAFTDAYEKTRSSTYKRLLTNLGLILITAGIALPVIIIKGLMGYRWGFFYDTTVSAHIRRSQEAIASTVPVTCDTCTLDA